MAFAGPTSVRAQDAGAAALATSLTLLRHDVPRVLYIAAHPDDEDTKLITYLGRGGHAEVAYLSLTRGEGGQNLIGDELGDELGVLRTEELLAARRIDGARQYFTRAYDFGYSKTAAEAFSHWPRDSLLGDVIRVVRAFKPQILVSTFSGTPLDAHGQHQVSGLLTRDAYEMAADTVRFPVREFGPPWMPVKLYRFARFNPAGPTLQINVGEYDPLSGRSYDEIASSSRSQHLSQGYRPNHRLGDVLVPYRREATRVNAATPAASETSIFDGVPGAAPLNGEQAWRGNVNLSRPATAFPFIAAFSPRDSAERARYNRAAPLAAGLVLEALASRPTAAVGDTISVTFTVYNRGDAVVRVVSGPGSPPRDSIKPGGSVKWVAQLNPSQPHEPWWLAQGRSGDLYATRVSGVSDDARQRERWAAVNVAVNGLPRTLSLSAPILFRRSEPPYGDVYSQLVVAPGLTVTPSTERAYIRSARRVSRDVHVTVNSSFAESRAVDVRLDLPAGLTASPATVNLEIPTGAARTLTFAVTGRVPEGEHHIRIHAQTRGEKFSRMVRRVEYPHIPAQRFYRPAVIRLTAVDINVPKGLDVGYIRGMADPGPKVLSELGVGVTEIKPEEIRRTTLSRFDVVIVGPRAYEANPELLESNPRLFEYVRRGGRLVVQFGQYPMGEPGVLPYPITITRPPDRVTDEKADVRLADASARELRYPNRITQKDFAGWVQERATFMPSRFDPRYRTFLSMNDAGELPKSSSVLVAPLGRGTYVYTTLALFRQFSEGVPGALRIFVNLISPRAR